MGKPLPRYYALVGAERAYLVTLLRAHADGGRQYVKRSPRRDALNSKLLRRFDPSATPPVLAPATPKED